MISRFVIFLNILNFNFKMTKKIEYEIIKFRLKKWEREIIEGLLVKMYLIQKINQ